MAKRGRARTRSKAAARPALRPGGKNAAAGHVRARRDLWKQIEQLKGRMTILLTTHYLEEAEALADRIAIMDRGELQAVGTAEQIKRQTGAVSLEEAFLCLTEEEGVEQ